MRGGWVYFITNRRDGVLYVGVTSNLPRRAFEHREGLVDGFTKQHGLKRLVYAERFDDIRYAIQREKTIKHWPRAWKVRLIHSMNPEWDDLYETLIQCASRPPLDLIRRSSRASKSWSFAARKAWMAGTSPAITA
ncbi:MAG: GIY-YIG nuclease family protein [Xanthobacteraceae bacterium]